MISLCMQDTATHRVEDMIEVAVHASLILVSKVFVGEPLDRVG